MRLPTLVVLVTAALLSVGTAQTCYYPDGNATDALVPCHKNALVTNCCRDSDLCLKNGLCFSPGLGSVVRRGCTDQKWANSVCPKACTSAEYRATDIVMTPCGEYGVFCCGQNSVARACCNANNNTVQVGTGEVISDGPPSPTTSATGTNATSTAAVTVCPPNAGSVEAKCQTPKNVAIALGAVLGVAILALAVLGFDWFGKKQRLKGPGIIRPTK